MPFLVPLPVLLLLPFPLSRSLHGRCTLPARPKPSEASMLRATATMSGTQIASFRPSASPPSLLAASKYMTCIFSMSINVHIFIVNLPVLPSGTPSNPHPMWGKVGERATPSVVIRPPSTVHLLFRIYPRSHPLLPTTLSAPGERPGSPRRPGSTRPAWRRPMRRGT